VYDAFGRRVQNGSVQYLYDGLNPVEELSGGEPVANILTGLGIDEYFQWTDSSGAMSFLTDAQNTTLALADSTGAIQTTYNYDPFGATSANYAPSNNPFQFTGREYDSTSIPLYFYRARYYNPVFQRFISRDPLGFGGGDVNLYAYVGNDPVDVVDPLGLSSLRFDRGNGTITVIDGNGHVVGTYPAANNAQSGSRGTWDPGTYDYSYHTTHPGDSPDSPYGSYGNYVFDVPGCTGCGVHSGRANTPDLRGRTGPQHATNGCIRTTDDATRQINRLISHGDPLTTLTVQSGR
jgi:RHS repeat-associated protein